MFNTVFIAFALSLLILTISLELEKFIISTLILELRKLMLRKTEELVQAHIAHIVTKTEMWLWTMLCLWLCPIGHN